MIIDIHTDYDKESLEEVEEVLDNFAKDYTLPRENKRYIIEKEKSNIAPQFVIYPREKGDQIQGASPINMNSSHVENLLFNDKSMSIIRLSNDKLVKILKENPRNSLN